MQGFWITFENGDAGYCDAETAEAATEKASELTGKTAKSVETLPYPATPIIWQKESEYGPCPAFCYQPRKCAGRTSCPTRPSCTS